MVAEDCGCLAPPIPKYHRYWNDHQDGQAGRVMLPKALRDGMELKEGSKLDVEETVEGIMLKPVVQAILDDQEEHIRKISGL